MRKRSFTLVALFVLPAGAAVTSWERKGNIVNLRLSDGSAQVEWTSTAAFRFHRDWKARSSPPKPLSKAAVELEAAEREAAIELKTEDLVLEILKPDLRMRVKTQKGALLLEDVSPAVREGKTIRLERTAIAQEKYFGLGARADKNLDARGLALETKTPFLLTSSGAGLHHTGAGSYHFDLAKTHPERWTVTVRDASELEFFFFWGSVKGIYEELLAVTRRLSYTVADLDVLTADRVPSYAKKQPRARDLCGAVASLVHESLSGALAPAVDLDSLSGPRAEQFFLAAPILFGSKARPAAGLRRQLLPYLITYIQEAADQGYPIVRPFPIHFEEDPAALADASAFMLGDEILVAPACDGAPRRSLYLPKGIWTDLRTGIAHQGRKTIELDTPGGTLPMLIRNGSILPLESLIHPGRMLLHYFPKLASEFFIYEADLEEISQVHASPALDYVRVESESRKDRPYEWIIHHLNRPREVLLVGSGALREAGSPGTLEDRTWHYDQASRELHVLIRAKTDGHEVVNVLFNTAPF